MWVGAAFCLKPQLLMWMSLAPGVFPEPGWRQESKVGGGGARWGGEGAEESARRRQGKAEGAGSLQARARQQPEPFGASKTKAELRLQPQPSAPARLRRALGARPLRPETIGERASLPRCLGPAPPAGSGLLRARVGFRFPAIVNSSVFVNRRWGHIPGCELIVPSLPLALRAGLRGWGVSGARRWGRPDPRSEKTQAFPLLGPSVYL